MPAAWIRFSKNRGAAPKYSTRQTKTATSSVSAAKLSEAADIAKLAESIRSDLHAVAERARTSFLALAGFTGRQIGGAVELKDGRFSWKNDDPVAAAIKKALDEMWGQAPKRASFLQRLCLVSAIYPPNR